MIQTVSEVQQEEAGEELEQEEVQIQEALMMTSEKGENLYRYQNTTK